MLNRRDFLASRPLANAAGQVLGALDDLTELAETLSEDASPPPETLLFRASRRAMAVGAQM